MKIIEISKTEKTPEVILDDEKKLLQITGKCLPENIRDFSQLVIEKLDNYLSQLSPDPEKDHRSGAFKVNFKLGYFNTAAAKFIADLLMMIDEHIQKEVNIKVFWYFEEDDHDMLEAGQDISKMVNVPMEYISIVKN
jgi:hypothetical protein